MIHFIHLTREKTGKFAVKKDRTIFFEKSCYRLYLETPVWRKKFLRQMDA
jgi:hypothetical protein